jgi:hypothetical protein
MTKSTSATPGVRVGGAAAREDLDCSSLAAEVCASATGSETGSSAL